MESIVFVIACVFLLGVPATTNGHTNAVNVRNRSAYNKCFDSFNPMINPITSSIRKAARLCFINANTKKQDELGFLELNRIELAKEMKRFKESMHNCTVSTFHPRYSECISDIIQINRQKINEISSRFDSSTYTERQIERDKEECIRIAVIGGQDQSSVAFKNLEHCLSSIKDF